MLPSVARLRQRRRMVARLTLNTMVINVNLRSFFQLLMTIATDLQESFYARRTRFVTLSQPSVTPD